ncbi:MAG: succinate dehydrogenase, cytochrome b556 subunit [Nevskiales bacterium]
MNTEAKKLERPLSPFMIGPYYRLQLTSVLSFTHRLFGIALSLGTVLLVTWLGALAAGPDAYAQVNGFLNTWLGKFMLIGWSYALFYHLCNGVRHLFWDAGLGFDIKTTYISGYAMVAASLLLTAGLWAVVLLG